MRVLIVDDEPLAQTSLVNVLNARNDVEGFDVANDGVEAVDKLRNRAYDVLLLDINMPSFSGIDVLDQLRESKQSVPSVIFVTAYQEHAVAAFERQAVDYVLKPFSTERVDEALDRAVEKSASQRAMKLLEALPILREGARPRTRKIAIKAKGRILFIDPLQVVSVQAEGNYILLQKESGSYLLRESISNMMEKLKPHGFIRIHRSLLVNGSAVEEIHPDGTGGYKVHIKGGKVYNVTRSYRKNLKSLAEFWIGTDRFLAD